MSYFLQSDLFSALLHSFSAFLSNVLFNADVLLRLAEPLLFA